MEFSAPMFFRSDTLELTTNLSYYPRGTTEVPALWTPGAAQDSKAPGEPILISNKYAFVAIDQHQICLEPQVRACFDTVLPRAAEGMNEKGLTISTLVLNSAGWQVPGSRNLTVSQVDFASWALGGFANAKELVRALRTTVAVSSCVQQHWALIPASLEVLCAELNAHYAIEDADGNSLVIEYIDGELKVHDNTVGTLTNDPPFEWHLKNIAQYQLLSNHNLNKEKPTSQILQENEVADIYSKSAGFNTFGIPGDYSSPSRFVKLFYNRAISSYNLRNRNRTTEDILVQQQAVLSAMYMPFGSVSGALPSPLFETANWSSLRVPATRAFYWHSYKDMGWQKVDLTSPALTSLTASVHFYMGKTSQENQIGATDMSKDLAAAASVDRS
jgi:choloylglycine hydrolase